MLVDLRNCRAADLMAQLPDESVDLVHADAPWHFDSGSTGGSMCSGSSDLYKPMSDADIADDIARAYQVAKRDSYLVFWVTESKRHEWWLAAHARRIGWEYVTAGTWWKSGGRLGMGHHLRTETESVLVYRKGNPKPQNRSTRNLWEWPPLPDHEKPHNALEALINTLCRPGGLVLDMYAGQSGSCAACAVECGRRYLGAEVDEDRFDHALGALAAVGVWVQEADLSALPGQPSLFGPRP